MKTTKLLILLFISFNYTFSQTQDAELFFNDGSSLEGYGMIYKNNKIKFRITLNGDPDVWTDLMVKSIIFYGFEMSIKYEYVISKPYGTAKLMEVLSEGNTNLYADVNTMTFYSQGNFVNGLPTAVSQRQITTSNLFIKKINKKYPEKLSGNFRKKSKEYFSDCIGVIEKLNTGEFRKSNANEMVDYYNDFCAE